MAPAQAHSHAIAIHFVCVLASWVSDLNLSTFLCSLFVREAHYKTGKMCTLLLSCR